MSQEKHLDTKVEATAARTAKEFEIDEVEELKIAILEKIDSLRADVLSQLMRRIDLKQAVITHQTRLGFRAVCHHPVLRGISAGSHCYPRKGETRRECNGVW
jgi:hypothetical protein